MENGYQKNYYSKKSIWKWVLIYVVIGVVFYGLVYYFFSASKGGYTYNFEQYQTQNNNYGEVMPVIKNSQDLMSASRDLDYVDVNQIDVELNKNAADAGAF